ncbi:Chalcone synthase 6, partial [Mucuna pruriens]
MYLRMNISIYNVNIRAKHQPFHPFLRCNMVSVAEIRKAQRAEGPATVLAIGTATPANCVDQ